MRGFTTVRGPGGPAFGLQTAIDRSVATGPCLFLAGVIISQTPGHGDFRFQNSLPTMPGNPADCAGSRDMSTLADRSPRFCAASANN